MLAALLLTTGATPEAALGRWLTPARHAVVEIARCGPSVCGRLVASDGLLASPPPLDTRNHDPALRTRPMRGLLMLQGFTWQDGAWTGGTLYNPLDGGTYRGTLTTLDADHLRLKGCIFWPLCRSQTWTRVP